MISFGYPDWLWTLFAVPVPLLIHLFFKRRKARVPFSTLHFFQIRQRQLAYRRHLREWLLLFIRSLILLCLAIALAKPLLRHPAVSLAPRTDSVLVLDDTLSMDRKLASGSSAFTFAIQKAEEILDTLSDHDRASVLFLSGRPGIELTRKHQEVRNLLQHARVTGCSGSYQSVLEQAIALLETESAPNREIYLLSDFQVMPKQTRAALLDVPKNIRFYFLLFQGAADNLSINQGSFSTKPQMTQQRMRIPYDVINHGVTDSETEVRLVIHDSLVQSDHLRLPAKERVQGFFDYIPAQGGVLNGYIEILDSSLALDNRVYFTQTVHEKIRVLLLESDPLSQINPFHFLKVAVDPFQDAAVNGIQTEESFSQSLTDNMLVPYHVALLANPDPIPPLLAIHLLRYLEQGGSVILFAGNRVSSATFCAFSDQLIPPLFGSLKSEPLTGLTFHGALASLNDLLQLNLIAWQRVYELTPPKQALVLAETAGKPLIVELPVGKGRLIVCAFSIRRDSGNWPELKSFPVSLIHLLTYAAHQTQQDNTGVCGHPIFLHTIDPNCTQLTLLMPGDTSLKLACRKGKAFLEETWYPGILTTEQASPRTLVSNPVAQESDLTAMDQSTAQKLLGIHPLMLRTDAAIAQQIQDARQGTDLSGFFIATILLLLLGELCLTTFRLSRMLIPKRLASSSL